MVTLYIKSSNGSMNNILYRGTCIYGYPKSNKKILTCKPMNTLAQRNTHINWLIFVDLNIILCANEKMGETPLTQI